MHPIRLFILLIALTLPFGVNAAPEANLWSRWTAHDPGSSVRVDHTAWDEWLERYVMTGDDGVNRVAYGSVSAADRANLDDYIDRLEAVEVFALNRSEQKAFWINLYNAGTVKVILDHWPTETIRDIDISPGFFADGPWGRKLITVEGVPVSLDDAEHRILRPIWQDPRIHYAVNCASIGCPNLATSAYTPDNMDNLLDDGARNFVNHPRGARIENGKLIVSSIYEWFRADFGGNDEGIIAHLRQYADESLKTAFDGITRIAGDDYDWSINSMDNMPGSG